LGKKGGPMNTAPPTASPVSASDSLQRTKKNFNRTAMPLEREGKGVLKEKRRKRKKKKNARRQHPWDNSPIGKKGEKKDAFKTNLECLAYRTVSQTLPKRQRSWRERKGRFARGRNHHSLPMLAQKKNMRMQNHKPPQNNNACKKKGGGHRKHEGERNLLLTSSPGCDGGEELGIYCADNAGDPGDKINGNVRGLQQTEIAWEENLKHFIPASQKKRRG